jgi:hypothetical protein
LHVDAKGGLAAHFGRRIEPGVSLPMIFQSAGASGTASVGSGAAMACASNAP